MRLGFAIAAHLDADILLLDEVFAVGDEAFQRKCFGKVFEFKQRGGTIVFVSHDATQVERLCERAVLLREGRLEFDGPTHEAIVRYRKGARRRGRPGGARRRPARVGHRRGDDRAARLVGARAGSGSSSSRASPSRSGSGSRPRTGSRRRSARAPRRGRPARRLRRARHRQRRLVGGCASCATTSTGCRSRTAASTSGSASPTRAASASCTGSTTRSPSSSIRR